MLCRNLEAAGGPRGRVRRFPILPIHPPHRKENSIATSGIRSSCYRAGCATGLPAGLFGSAAAEVAAGDHAGEQPVACGPGAAPVVAPGLQQALGEHDVAVLAALALLDRTTMRRLSMSEMRSPAS